MNYENYNHINYKERHEAFVSNLSGTSVFTLIICLFHIPVFILLLKIYQNGSKPLLLREFIVFMIPLLSIITVTVEFNSVSLISLVFILILWIYRNRRRIFSARNPYPYPNLHRTSFITLLKGANVALTCLAILAVDFPTFPRYFGKTEYYGISLMDIGVGTFIFSSGITSKYARGVSRTIREATVALPTERRSDSLFSSFSQSLEHCMQFLGISYQRFLVLLLGVGRLVALKLLQYPEHVSEYGIHWNFFITLFAVWMTTDIMHQFIPRRYLVGISCLWLTIYQVLLCNTSLTTYMFSNARETFLDANKEGTISLNGYIPLFLLSESLAFHFFYSQYENVSNGVAEGSSHPKMSVAGGEKLKGSDAYSPLLHQRRELPDSRSDERDDTNRNDRQAQEGDSSTLLTVKELSTCLKEDSKSKDLSSNSANTIPLSFNTYLLKRCSITLLGLWLLWGIQEMWIQPTSRRLCNSAYVTLVLALSLLLVITIHIADVLGGLDVPILTLQYMNQHSIIVFLGANLLTGLINHLFRTIDMADGEAILILIVYTFAVTSIAWLTDIIMKK